MALAHHDSSAQSLAERFSSLLASEPRLPWNIESALRGKRAVIHSDHSIEHLRSVGACDEVAALMGEIGVVSAIVSPLTARGRVVGVMIWMHAESERRYDQSDLELAEELARRAALAADGARLLQEAQAARDEAQNANRAKDEFLAVVSHELRTPLTPILGWLELLRDPNADDALRAQAYDVIERNAQAQAQLINDILDVSRITTGKLRLAPRSIALNQLVEKAVEALVIPIAAKNLTLSTRIDDVGLARVDPNRLQQVVWNLLQNAIKFTPAGGSVEVVLERLPDPTAPSARVFSDEDSFPCDAGDPDSAPDDEGASGATRGRAVLRVRDSGQGIEADLLPHVFDRFRQGDSSSTRKAGGIGLGLAIVAHIVELHGGQVSADSAGKNQGASFCVELPLLTASPQLTARPNPTEATPAETTPAETTPAETTLVEATLVEATIAEAAAVRSEESISEGESLERRNEESGVRVPRGSVWPAHIEEPIPQREAKAKAKAARPSENPGAATLAGVRVLIVDDEPDTRDMLSRVLSSAGATVRAAASALSALEAAEIFGPDVVVSDIGMPGMDGYALRRRLQDRYADLPVLALTAYASSIDAQKALDAGFTEFLTKPISPTNLIDAVALHAPPRF